MFPDSEAVFDYLMRFVNVERGQATEFKLDRMLHLASLLGNPHLGRTTVHVAGSKGKGSVSAMTAAILHAGGFKSGLYTSPHLIRWKERIALADIPMPEATLVEAAERLLPLIGGKSAQDFPGDELPTFFELTTLIAFLCFRAEACDAQVIETGLGGRLDSTNIVVPDVSAITPIELEHVQYLGDTIEKIAGEKAGIIKPGKPVCVAVQKTEADRVFGSKARECGSPLYRVGEEFLIDSVLISAEGTRCRIVPAPGARSDFSRGLPREGIECASPMIGAIQASNMALACLAASLAAPSLAPRAFAAGLGAARLPARYELVSRDPAVVLDGAHTPESVALSLATTRALFPQGFVLLFACAVDKKHESMAHMLGPHAKSVFVTRPGSFKVSDPEAVYRSFRESGTATGESVIFDAEPRKAFASAYARAAQSGCALLVCGSFYLCAEVREVMKTMGIEPEPASQQPAP